MSADEDTELRDLVAQTLESSGVLGKIRAELRATVFLALEDHDTVQNKTPFVNKELKKFISTKEGVLVVSLVQEFLETFHLDFTLAVFNPETNFGERYEGRERLAKDLGIGDSEKCRDKPLLCELLKRADEQKGGSQRTISKTKEYDVPKDLAASQITDIKQKFLHYDRHKTGIIDMNNVRKLFTDVLPSFHKNMLERYVNDELLAGQQDFSNGVNFEAFVGMYRRLIDICQSAVSHRVTDHSATTSPRSPRKPTDNPIGSLGLKSFRPSDREGTSKERADPGRHARGQRSPSGGSSDASEDSFFDDVPGGSSRPAGFSSLKKKEATPMSPPKTPPPKSSTGGMSSLINAPSLTGAGGMGSLAGAPPLSGRGGPKDGENPDWKDLKVLDSKLNKLSFDLSRSEASDDYDDDFQSSQDSQSVGQAKGRSRSLKSADDRNNDVSDDISEDIQEDLDISVDDEDDLLGSSQDKFDELTTDRSASQLSGRFDYIEDAQLDF